MKKLSANYIFPISSKPIKNGVVIVDDKGMVLDVLGDSEGLEDVEVFEGIICPGFVNTHCHLELSHLRGKLPERQGLVNFLISLFNVRVAGEEIIKEAMKQAEQEMIANGIIAVGDISNETDSFVQKADSKLSYYTFIETLGFQPDRAEPALAKAMRLHDELTTKYKLQGSVTPHAPYSVSEELFGKTNAFAIKNDCILSIHNQESEAENLFYKQGRGELLKLYEHFDIDISCWKPTGKTSLQSVLGYFPVNRKLLLVHNTYTTFDEINSTSNHYSIANFAHNKSPNHQSSAERSRSITQSPNNICWCFCPNANLYIENRLPDLKLFINAGVRITIGTDSLASNRSLSILDELKTISENTPQVKLEQLLLWATKNGAEFLGFDEKFGTIEKGKCPGIILIENVDVENLQMTGQSSVRRII
ncbi:MAG: amidohydrolase family protein [Bacteroidota bacterium]